MDYKKVEKSVKVFTKNKYWKRVYEEAPSDNCRKRIALSFYYSHTLDESEEYEAEEQRVEDSLSKEDWRYLYEHEGNNPWKAYCKKKMME